MSLNDEERVEILKSAEHWESLAAAEERMVQYERKLGIQPSTGSSAGLNKAATYRQTAKALRLEAETGNVHCTICLGDHPNHKHKELMR